MELGKLIGKFAEVEASEALMHEDVSAHYAPSECHDLVARSADRELEELETELKITFSELTELVEEKGFCFRKIYDEAVGRIFSQRSMFSLQ